MNCGFIIKSIYEQYLILLSNLFMHDLNIFASLFELSVWFGQLDWFFLAMREVLSFGFNLAVLNPSDRKGNGTYCIVAIEDKKMGLYHIA